MLTEHAHIIRIGNHEDNYEEMCAFLQDKATFVGDFGDPGEGKSFVVNTTIANIFYKRFDMHTFAGEQMWESEITIVVNSLVDGNKKELGTISNVSPTAVSLSMQQQTLYFQGQQRHILKYGTVEPCENEWFWDVVISMD